MPDELVNYLIPVLKARSGQTDPCELFDQMEAAYQIGILAGAILADAPAATVDRFERGLAFIIAEHGDYVNDEPEIPPFCD